MNGIKENKIGILIPVRVSSKRFPNKAMYKSNFGLPIEFLIKNLSNNFIKKKNIVICTTLEKNENKLSNLVKKMGCKLFRGSKNDIIDRFYKANLIYKYDYLIEVDGDDIMTDVKFIKICLNNLIKNNLDFVYTTNLPIGMNCKVFNAKALNLAQKIKLSKNNANGFMQFFYKNPLIKKKNILFKKYNKYKIRLTLDYIEDIRFFEIMILIFKIKNLKINLKNCINLIKNNKDLSNINFFRNNDYNANTKKMKPLFYKSKNTTKKIFIS